MSGFGTSPTCKPVFDDDRSTNSGPCTPSVGLAGMCQTRTSGSWQGCFARPYLQTTMFTRVVGLCSMNMDRPSGRVATHSGGRYGLAARRSLRQRANRRQACWRGTCRTAPQYRRIATAGRAQRCAISLALGEFACCKLGRNRREPALRMMITILSPDRPTRAKLLKFTNR
jgi:hypothetical protein